MVEALMSEWLKHHVSNLAAPDRYIQSVRQWMAFFDEARRRRWIISGPTVADLTPELQARFRSWRAAMGVGGHTISRDLAALRGPLNWAWKHQLIEHPPFIADVPPHQKAPPRDRILSFEEIAGILDACSGKPEREHLVRFIVIELGTAGRPQAVLELTDRNIDLRRNLIDPNRPGELHYRKRRAIVPIAKAVRPWVSGVTGKIIKYKVPIAEKHRVPGGPSHFERDTGSIKTAWKAACAEAGVTGATPKTLRHTMLTWLAERGVPYEQRQMLAGHAPQGTTARNYEHLSPEYLRRAVVEIDAFFDRLRKHTTMLGGRRDPSPRASCASYKPRARTRARET
jgi:integrase